MAMRCGDAARRRYRPVPLDSMAASLRVAATTGEDARFWDHAGLDYVEIRHALGYRRAGFAWKSPRDREELGRLLGHSWARREALRASTGRGSPRLCCKVEKGSAGGPKAEISRASP